MRTERFIVLVAFATTSVVVSALPRPQKPSEQPRAIEAQKTPTPAPKAEAPAADPKVNATAAIQQDFKARIDKYIAVRKKAAGDAPPLKETKDPAKIKAAEEGLAAAIRSARPDAQTGDIFSTEIQSTFRRLLEPEIKGEEGAHAKKILKDDAPSTVPFKVNAKYPEGKPLPTVPANLLLNLPKLPSEVEYRIVGKTLVLRDTGADLIVDFMPNAIK